MDTWLIGTQVPLDIDAQIVGALRPRADDLTGGGIALNMGILAANGQVYRVARAWDLTEYQRASAALERLGLVGTGRHERLHDISFEELFEVADVAAVRALQRREQLTGSAATPATPAAAVNVRPR